MGAAEAAPVMLVAMSAALPDVVRRAGQAAHVKDRLCFPDDGSDRLVDHIVTLDLVLKHRQHFGGEAVSGAGRGFKEAIVDPVEVTPERL